MDWGPILIGSFFLLALMALLGLVLQRRLARRSVFPSDAWEPYLAHDDADLEGAPGSSEEVSPGEGASSPEPALALSSAPSPEPAPEPGGAPSGAPQLSLPELAPAGAAEEGSPRGEAKEPELPRPPKGDGDVPPPTPRGRGEEEIEDIFSLLRTQEEGKGHLPRPGGRSESAHSFGAPAGEGVSKKGAPRPGPRGPRPPGERESTRVGADAGGDGEMKELLPRPAPRPGPRGGAAAGPSPGGKAEARAPALKAPARSDGEREAADAAEEGRGPGGSPSGIAAEPARPPLEELDLLIKQLCPGGIPVLEEMEREVPPRAGEVLEAAGREAKLRGERVEAKVFYRLGILSLLCREPSAAAEHLKAALRRTNEFGPVLNGLGVAQFALGKGEAALSYLKEGLREAGEDRGLRLAILRNLSQVYAHRRSFRPAAQCCQGALDLLGKEEGGPLRARLLARQGRLLKEVGEAEGARESLEEAIELDRAHGRPGGAAASLSLLAQIHREEGEMDAALRSLEEALALWREAGDRGGEAHALGALGLVCAGREEFDRALECCQRAQVLHRELGNPKGEAADLGNIGNVFYFRGDLERALAAHEEALALHREAGDRKGVATSLGNLGRVKFELGARQEAERLLEEALGLFRQEGAYPQAEKVCRILDEMRQPSPQKGDGAEGGNRP